MTEFRSGSAGRNLGAGTVLSFDMPYPPGLISTDAVVVVVHGEHDTAAPTVTVSGLTELGTALYRNPIFTRVFVGTGFSGVGSWTVTFSSAVEATAVAAAFSDADASAMIRGTAFNDATGSPANFTVPAITTISPGFNALVFHQQWSSDYPESTAPPFTELTRHGNASILGIDDPIAGDTGTVAGVGQEWNQIQAFLIAIPDSAPAPVLPSAVDDLTAVGGVGQAVLTWSAPSPGDSSITDYEVEYRVAGQGNFRVSGTQILDPEGNVFYPFGVNTGVHHTGFPYPFRFQDVPQTGAIDSYEFDQAAFPSKVEQARLWGINFLRTNIVAFNDDVSFENPPVTTGSAMADHVANSINELLAAGFVVMMDGRTNQPGGSPGGSPALGNSHDLNARSFISRCMELWGDNPLFWINPFNEPYPGESPAEISAMITLYSDWIPFLRNLGYANPIVFDIPRYSQAINKVADGTFDAFMELDDNMILSWHPYGASSPESLDSDKIRIESLASQAHARGHCILLGEVGYTWTGWSPYGNLVDGTGTQIPFGPGYQAHRNAAEWAVEDGRAEFYNMGIAAWHAGHDDFNFTANRLPFVDSANNGTGLSDWGLDMWNKGQQLYANRAIAGKYDAYTIGSGGVWTPFNDGISSATGATVTGL